MKKKIGVIATDQELKNRIIELFSEEYASGEIIIDILDSNMINEQGRLLEKKGVKAIVARSGGYRHTIGTVNIPIIHLKVSTPDILQAISIANEYKKDIVLVISDLDYFDYDSWKNVINANIILERFNYKDEIESRVLKYLHKKNEVVIVGGGIPCSIARNLGMDNVFINAGRESIYESIRLAKEMIDNTYEQKYNSEILRTVLDKVHDAVIFIKYDGSIALYNERAKSILHKNKKEILGKQIESIVPELSLIQDVLKDKKEVENQIKKIKGITFTVNTSILRLDGQVEGVLCSLQDISKLQKLEKRIRNELHMKGHIAKYNFNHVVAVSELMKDVVRKAKKIGASDNTVIIYGESGTGKEIIAQSIHNISKRREEPFVAINCAAISESLLESELFGYEEGSFTGARKGGKPGLFELAHGGTILLDEINSISLNLQAKLLRVLQEKETMRIGSDYVIPLDIRVIAATNEELKVMVEEERFRKDLFYRLNVLELHIPPLRERKEDIIPLFQHYLKDIGSEGYNLDLRLEIQEKLLNYRWPGNGRELRNIAERYIIFDEIDLNVRELSHKKEGMKMKEDARIDLKEINRLVEEKIIDMLESQGMGKNEIANILGISRTSLWKKTKGNNV